MFDFCNTTLSRCTMATRIAALQQLIFRQNAENTGMMAVEYS
jgi:hypothetical protein